MAKDEKKEIEDGSETPEGYGVPIHYVIVGAILITLAVWATFPLLETAILFAVTVLGAGVVLLLLSFIDIQNYEKNRSNILPFFFSIIVVYLVISGAPMLLGVLFSMYLLISVLMAGKNVRLQTAIIIALAITAIIFRVYPAMPDSNNPMAGHLISMDDPYYHYKQTERLYALGDIPAKDHTIYPPDGKTAPDNFPYYYNNYMTWLTGSTLHDVTILYPVFFAILGTLMVFFLIKELLGDWKSGFLGGVLFATMPVVLTKSVAGAVEEDFMGMAIGMFALYLLAKALNSKDRTNLKFSVLAGFGFFLTLGTWKGIEYLYAVPFGAIALYLFIVLVLNLLTYIFKRPGLGRSTWDVTRTGIIAGVIPILGHLIFYSSNLSIPTYITIPFGLILLIGLVSELLNVSLFKGEDKKTKTEKRVFVPVAIVLILAILAGLAFLGVNQLAEAPQSAFEAFAGAGSTNFLVDKTISEQAELSKGDIAKKLSTGFKNYYGIGEIMTVLMLFILPLYLSLRYSRDLIKSVVMVLFILILMLAALILNSVILLVILAAISCTPSIYFAKDEDKEMVHRISYAYVIFLAFFGVAMYYVWVEARLAFSQALGFIFMGATAGLLLPKDLKEVTSLKIIPLLLVAIILPMTIFYPGILGAPTSWDAAQRGAGVDPAWFLGVKWLDKNTASGEYIGTDYVNGDFVLTWWDYGHFITALSGDTVITDPLHSREDYILETARFFYNTTTEDAAMKWLMEQPWNLKDENGNYKVKYIILDESLISKASALAFLGTNYYQYPNGQAAVNGFCTNGEICQNVYIELGGQTLMAEKTDTGYTCSQGVVCKGDALAGLDDRRCCEANPTQCCDTSLDWHVIPDEGGSAKLLRSPGEPVYGQYQIDTGQYRKVAGSDPCETQYRTSLEPFFLVEGGQQKKVVKRYLYDDIFVTRNGISGLPYADGSYYPFFIIYQYGDGSQDVKFLTTSCDVVDANGVLASGKDLLVPLRDGVRLSNNDIVSRTFIHVPQKFMNNMFTDLYIKNAQDLNYFKLIRDNDTKKFFPLVKIYKINYPDEIPTATENTATENQESAGGAAKGDVVQVDYTGRFENGTVFDTSAGRQPLEFTLGSGQVIPGFDNAIQGMKVGETKTVTIPPEQAYGTSGSNPLANKTLVFEVTLVAINPIEKSQEEPTTGASLNMTFDDYDPSLAASYGLTDSALVWNCKFIQKVTSSDSSTDLNSLRQLACIMTNANPADLCEGVGIKYDESQGLTTNDPKVTDLLSALKQTKDTAECGINGTVLQAFYSSDCQTCAAQKRALDQMESEFGTYLNITHHCIGPEAYCIANSNKIIAGE